MDLKAALKALAEADADRRWVAEQRRRAEQSHFYMLVTGRPLLTVEHYPEA
jgi:hypothetical protein